MISRMEYQCKNCLNIFTYQLKYIVHQQYQMCKKKTLSMIKKKILFYKMKRQEIKYKKFIYKNNLNNFHDLLTKYNFKIKYYKKIFHFSKTIEFNKLFIDSIKKVNQKELSKNIWKNSPFKLFKELSIDGKGEVGEIFINEIFNHLNLKCEIMNKKSLGKCFDALINNKKIEIKTSSLGFTQSFQHELGEKPWMADYMLFIDIGLDCIYITLFKNFSEYIYKNKKKLIPIFSNKCITWRKRKGAFKLDTSININELNCKKGYSVKLDSMNSISKTKNLLFKLFQTIH